MRKLPDAYVCASDRQAILLMGALKELSISIPDEIAVTGFDNLPETLRQIPPLTTVDAHSKYQGELAVKKILERLADPSKPYEFIHTECSLVLRKSTGHEA
jgi:LacI family transcriptional regulator